MTLFLREVERLTATTAITLSNWEVGSRVVASYKVVSFSMMPWKGLYGKYK